MDQRQRFVRAGQDASGAPYPAVSQSGPLTVLPLAAVRSRFGLERFAFAAAVHAPNACGRRRFARDGPQRYALVETDLWLITASLAAAVEISPRLSVGVAVELTSLPRAVIGMVVDSYWLDTTHPDHGPYDTLARIDVRDVARPNVSVGLAWEPLPWLAIGLSARLLPVSIAARGRFRPEFLGAAVARLYDAGELTVTDDRVALALRLPPVVRLGVRLIGCRAAGVSGGCDPWGDLEAALVYEAWSVHERLDVGFAGAFRLRSATHDLALNPLDLPRRYRDTISVRLGGSVQPGLRRLMLSGGVFFESAAGPRATTSVAATAGHRLGFGVGVAATLGPLALTAAYAHVFELPVEVALGSSAIVQQRPASPCAPPYDDARACGPNGAPSGPQVGAGSYTAGAGLVSVGLEARF